MSNYDDIIHLSRPVSQRHAPMSMLDRAAQFSPFAALTGHEAAIEETARLTDSLSVHEDFRTEGLNELLNQLSEHLNEHPVIKLTYFLPDERKEGGSYQTILTPIKKIDTIQNCLLLPDYSTIPFAHILDMESDIFHKE